MTLFTLVCTTCCAGWTSKHPTELCKCGRPAECRGNYRVVAVRP